MSIGYACITVGVPNTKLHTTVQKNATPEKLEQLIGQNLAVLLKMLEYNDAHDIRVFRVSSDIIPFGSSPVNTLDWRTLFEKELSSVGALAKKAGIRLSMHPGQYTVLNSPNPDVVERAVEDLRYHNRFLDALGAGPESKLVLHIGGVYGDKAAAIQRFKQNYRLLPAGIRGRLVIENDDKMYNAAEVLAISQSEGIPMVFDNLHHAINPSRASKTDEEWIVECRSTWRAADGRQKIHYSQQAEGRRPGSHSDTIYVEPFMEYYQWLADMDIDVMLEVKDKNLSAVKCVNCTTMDKRINRLEEEWALYKYTVLEHSAAIYNEIRGLLKDKTGYPAVHFYSLLEKALAAPVAVGAAANAAQHVWGYFKNKATAAEKSAFEKVLKSAEEGVSSFVPVKGRLRRMAEKYDEKYLLGSYYFVL